MIKNIVILGDSFTYGHGCDDRVFYYDTVADKWVGDDPSKKRPSEYCWPSLLQKDFPELNIVNLALPGNSSPMMFRQLIRHYRNKEVMPGLDLILFCGTNPNRAEAVRTWETHEVTNGETDVVNIIMSSLTEQKGWWLETAPDGSTGSWANALKMYSYYMWDETLGEADAISNLLAIYAWAILNKFEFRWSMPFKCFRPEVKDQTRFGWTHIMPCTFTSLNTYNYKEIAKESNVDPSIYLASDGHANNFGHSVYYTREILPMLNKLGIVKESAQ